MRGTVGRGDLGEPQLTDVARQRRLRDVVTFRLQPLAELLLAAHHVLPDDPQDGRVPLGFHEPEI